MGRKVYDIIIIGGGAAGLTAGLYTSRARLNTLLLEELTPGGQASTTEWIENYPGFPEGISGAELMERLKLQALRFGLEIQNARVEHVSLKGAQKLVHTGESQFKVKALIIASGTHPHPLGVRGEKRFLGKGVSYCATCDGAFFKNTPVAVVGGSDSAVKEALFLTKFAKPVYLIHRRADLRAEKIIQEKAMKSKKIFFIWNSVVEEISGREGVEFIKIKNLKTGKKTKLQVKGVFIYIGSVPNTKFLENLVELDEHGFIITKDEAETNVPGIFAAGDVRKKLLRQIATAVGDGATAAMAAERYLSKW